LIIKRCFALVDLSEFRNGRDAARSWFEEPDPRSLLGGLGGGATERTLKRGGGRITLDAVDWIESKPGVMMGKPVVTGTRITVECLLERLGAGESVDQIVAEHPRLSRESVLAAIDFAAKALRADVVYPLSGHAA